MKRLLLAACFMSAPAFSVTPVEAFDQITPTLQKYPDIKLVEICVPEGFCQIFTDFTWERKGGSADLLYQAPKGQDEAGGVAAAVGEIVGQTAKSVGMGGRISVEYEQTKKDGTKTKVKVEASFGVGAGAAAGAAPSTIDDK